MCDYNIMHVPPGKTSTPLWFSFFACICYSHFALFLVSKKTSNRKKRAAFFRQYLAFGKSRKNSKIKKPNLSHGLTLPVS